jgi:hypothetical protein
MTSSCTTFCSHGGICELDAGHEGLHDSSYCTWTDDEAISRKEADALLVSKGGADLLAFGDVIGAWGREGVE